MALPPSERWNSFRFGRIQATCRECHLRKTIAETRGRNGPEGRQFKRQCYGPDGYPISFQEWAENHAARGQIA